MCTLEAANHSNKDKKAAYLFSYFTGNKAEQERTCLAVSRDGYNFQPLNGGNPVVLQNLGSGCARDPYILRGKDDYFYLLATDLKTSDGWDNTSLVTWRSKDLITWEDETIIPMAEFYPEGFVSSKSWAPHAMWDKSRDEYMLYWAADRKVEGADTVKLAMWYAYTKDFKTLTSEPDILFVPYSGNDALDADIFFDGAVYHMYYKDGGHDSGIKKTTSTELSGPYGEESKLLTIGGVEGPAIYQFIGEDKWMLIYDIYTNGKYAASTSTDLEHFTRIDETMMNLNTLTPRHGSVLHITEDEYHHLIQAFGNTQMKIEEKGECTMTPNTMSNNNPVLKGLYADPDILTYKGKYYLYPTTDGHDGWSGTYFKVFSSDNLIDWEDHGIILDVTSDEVPWATGNAWAPAIIEKDDKFYFFYCASQQVGVAVADSAVGPFKNLSVEGPLVPKSLFSEGGQAIDPDIFKDEDGKCYIYVGNCETFVAELHIEGDTVELATPWAKITPKDGEFREAMHVMKRNGVYHFTWSVDDTRSENYRLRYGTATSPFGPIEVEKGILLEKNKALNILGTGHHTILEIPERDEYYVVYHRFAEPAPAGVFGDARGFNREVCMDKLTFDEITGKMQKVKPTVEGITEAVDLP